MTPKQKKKFDTKPIKTINDGCEIEKLVISPFTYDIICSSAPRINEELDDLSGYIETDFLRIYIKSSLPEGKKSVTILHEALHGMLMHSGLNSNPKEDPLYEQIIECLSHSLYTFIRENPEFIEYLKKD